MGLVGRKGEKRTEKTYIFRLGFSLKVGFDGFVLLVELGQIRYKVFDDVGMRKGVDAGFLFGVGWNAACWYEPGQQLSRHRYQ